MKKIIAVVALSAIVLSGCGAGNPDAANATEATPSPSPTVNPLEAMQKKVAELLAEYYDAGSIKALGSNGAALLVRIELPEATDWEDAPEDWGDIVTNAETASAALKEGWNADTYKSASIQLVDAEDSVLLVVIDGRTLFNKYSTNSNSSTGSATITLAEYNSIDTGMTYQAVCNIIGGPGSLEVSSEVEILGTHTTQIYYWQGAGDDYAGASITFQDGVVFSKFQMGLQ